jgi:type IV pilus assembly protein PilW
MARAAMRGMSMVELLIGMAVCLLIMAVVGGIFGDASRSRGSIERAARLMDNASYAQALLEDEVRMAGFTAEMNFTGVAWQTTDPCITDITALGWSATPFTAPVSMMGIASDAASPACLPSRKANTAALIIRRLSGTTTPIASATNGPFLQVSTCTSDPQAWVFSNAPADFVLRKLDCATPADVRQFLVRVYYVADCNQCGTDTTPTLKLAELKNGAMAVSSIAEGIEDLELEYGFDGDNDGLPDVYLRTADGSVTPAYGDWSNAMTARIHLLARSSDLEPGYVDASKRFNLGASGYTNVANDGYKRVVLNSMVRLANAAGQRETP